MAAVLGVPGQRRTVLQRRRTDVAADVVAGQVVGIDAGLLDRAPRQPQRHPLLGIHRGRFPRGDAEEPRVERCCAGEESAQIVDRLVAVAAGSREQVLQRPAPVGRERAECFALFGEQRPESVGVLDPTGRLQRHPDDHHGIVGSISRHHHWGHLQSLTSRATSARCPSR